MTSYEIAAKSAYTETGRLPDDGIVQICVWLKEIALQLAIHNEGGNRK